jgi:AraC-like DNA-binding protein
VDISLLHILSIIAIFQAIMMAVFFVRNTASRRLSNVLLASMLLVFAAVSAASLYKSIVPISVHIRFHRQIFLTGHLAYVAGPLLYFYIRSVLDAGFKLRAQEWLQFLPFPAAVIYSFLIFPQYDPFLIWKYPGRIFFSGTILLQNLLYGIAALRILRIHGLTIRSFLSYLDNAKLEWVRLLTGGYIVLWMVQLQVFLTWDVLENPSWCPYARSLYFLSTFLLFNGLVYLGLKKPELLRNLPKYQTSALTSTEKERYKKRLLDLMEREKLYMNSDLALTDLARALELNPLYVSQIINEMMRQNFSDFVNKYRIDHSKQMLVQPKQELNMFGIALESGFNSKSAFNRAFKKHTGLTPKEFRKKN